MTLSARLSPFFADYSHHHRTVGNQVCHYFGITMITVSLLGLLSHLVIFTAGAPDADFRLDGGTLLLILVATRYIYLDWKLGSAFTAMLLGLYFLGRSLPLPLAWGAFVLGWIIQFYGHSHYEKNRPAFTKNIEHVLIGPLWIFAKLLKYR